MNRNIATAVLLATGLLACKTASAQLSLTNIAPSATIDFSGAMQSGVGNSVGGAYMGAGFSANPSTTGRLNSNAWAVTGWSDGDLAFGGTKTAAATDYTRGATAISQTTGGFYAYTGSPASATNPMFYIQPGGNDFAPGTLTLRIVNNGTTNITSLAVAYNLYVRNDQNRGNSFNFSYSTDNTTYTPVGSLDYTSPAALDNNGLVLVGGTAPSRSTTISGISVGPNAYVYLRWSSDDVNGSNARDEFGLDDIAVTASYSVALPLKLVSFTGTPKESGLLLRWNTACEKAMAAYEVEKSADGAAFKTIATVNARNEGCVTEVAYQYYDADFSGSAAYRLAMREADGARSYSPVRYFRGGKAATEVRVSPNPATNELRVEGLEAGAAWRITDSYGRMVADGVTTRSATIISLSNLAGSMYFLQAAGVQPVRFVKQ